MNGRPIIMDSNVPLYFTVNTQDFAFHIALDAPKHPNRLPAPVYVRDPPRERLPAASDVDAWGLGIDSRLVSAGVVLGMGELTRRVARL